MLVKPNRADFDRVYRAGKSQVVWTRLVADLETPVSAMLKLSGGRSNCFLLESVEGGAVRGRYSIIGIDPDLIFRINGETAELNRDPATKPSNFEPLEAPPLDALRAVLDESRIDLPDALPRMSAGIFGYLGYDTVRLIEDLGPVNPDPIGVPESILVRPT
ncbi:MAG: anthranilate synthase component I, partial [Alphaproteobacteria bacterium]